jgi:hypothetical protein
VGSAYRIPRRASATLVRYPARFNHLLHLGLTALTRGLWLPIRLILAIIDGIRRQASDRHD